MQARPVLAVAAHPDDEVLMAGATLARHAAEGARVEILFVADGATARFAGPDGPGAAEAIAAREEAARAAARILGARPPRFLRFPDNRLDSAALLDIVKAIEAVVAEIGPEAVYTHFEGDLNIDHAIVGRAVRTACRPTPGRGILRLYAGETLSASEWGGGPRFRPNRYVGCDAAGALATKIAALKAYGEEIPPAPHPRSLEAVEALARSRGAEAGLDHAEAFEIIREIAP